VIELSLSGEPKLTDYLRVCLALPEDERQQYAAMAGAPFDAEIVAAALMLASGPKWTIYDGRKYAIAVGGYLEERPGVWRSWMAATDECWTPENAEGVTAICVGAMQSMFYDHGAHRLETVCLATRKRARSWYTRHLGLKYEGLLRQAGVGGEDVAIYATTRDAIHVPEYRKERE
jgi:hypothetical protein